MLDCIEFNISLFIDELLVGNLETLISSSQLKKSICRLEYAHILCAAIEGIPEVAEYHGVKRVRAFCDNRRIVVDIYLGSKSDLWGKIVV